MNLENLLPMVAAAGLFDLFLIMIWLVIVIARSFQRQAALKVRVKMEPDGTRQESAQVESAAPAPPEAEPGPDFAWPEAEADGKVPVSCTKCGTAYRVYPNRLWYTCTKCQEKVWVVAQSPEDKPKVEPKAEVKAKVVAPKKDKFKSPANLI